MTVALETNWKVSYKIDLLPELNNGRLAGGRPLHAGLREGIAMPQSSPGGTTPRTPRGPGLRARWQNPPSYRARKSGPELRGDTVALHGLVPCADCAMPITLVSFAGLTPHAIRLLERAR